jgi:signal transduction histidine kinase
MKKEKIENEKVQEYLKVVDKQSLRLNKLTEDVIEASKAATGNINVELSSLNLSEMLAQSLGEYENKFKEKELDIVYSEQTLPVSVMADGRLLWRVIENLFSNVYKYAMEGTRLYIDIDNDEEYVKIIMKNVSKYQLNISSDELMQRFVRGDSSRSTSGNGLGLSIAESLTKLQGGTLDIQIIGDSFIAVLNLRKPRSIVPEQNQ